MNKKGFTLIEMLATITILGIIMVIAFPSVISLIRNNDKHLAEQLGTTMVTDAKKYVNDERLDGTGCKTIRHTELIYKKLLKGLSIGNKFSCSEGEVQINFYLEELYYSY